MASLHWLAAALLLSGCAAAAPAPPAAAATAESDLDFAMEWPREAEAIPALRRWFEARRQTAEANARRMVADDREARGPGVPFHRHEFEERWTIVGDSVRLLSLQTQTTSYSGGAHGNFSFSGLVWDRETDRPVDAAALFAGGLAPFTDRYCAALDALREERRGEPVVRGSDFMTDCPVLAEQLVLPEDRDRDGRFDTLGIYVAPYTAGPWAEGPYETALPLTRADLGRVDAAYRASFAAAGAR